MPISQQRGGAGPSSDQAAMRFDARTQVLSFRGDYPRRSRTRTSHSKRAALDISQSAGKTILAEGDVGVRAELFDRSGSARQRLFPVNAPDLTGGKAG